MQIKNERSYLKAKHVITVHNPQNCPFTWRISIFLGLHKSARQTASRSVQLFEHSASVCLTHRQTHRHIDHAACDIGRNRPYLMHCVYAIWSNNQIYLNNVVKSYTRCRGDDG